MEGEEDEKVKEEDDKDDDADADDVDDETDADDDDDDDDDERLIAPSTGAKRGSKHSKKILPVHITNTNRRKNTEQEAKQYQQYQQMFAVHQYFHMCFPCRLFHIQPDLPAS